MTAANSTFEREVVVLEIQLLQEISTGDTIHQVAFGEYINNNAKDDSSCKETKKVPIIWLALNITLDAKIPYPIGSKWKLTTTENGTINLVGLK